ncbi:MAG: hypothetical protein Q9168_005072 [Polycauliona sp. 1 TL-2023]
MAERRRSSASSNSQTSQPRFSSSSNPDIFCDEYALDSLHPTDGFRPHGPTHHPTHDPPSPAQSEDPLPTLPSRDSAFTTRALSQRTSSLLAPSDLGRYGSTHRGQATTLSDENPNPALYRSTSRASTMTLPRTQSPYQGATGPSQPYAMYPQDVGFSRTPSMATTSTVRPRERSYAGPTGPTQPYGMYPQNTVPEDDAGTLQSLHQPAPVGFPGRSQAYRRRLGPDTEDADDLIGPDGYTEQLPPYTRYPDDVPPKEGAPVPVSPIGVAHVETEHPRVTSANPFQSRESLQEPGESIPERTEQHRSSDDATAVASSESLPRDEGGNFKERVKEKGKRRICCGKVPFWVVAVLVLVMIAVLAGTIGGVVGNARGEQHAGPPPPSNKFHHAELAETQHYIVSTITTTSLVDATPLASTPTNLPSLPTGSFFVPLRNLSSSENSCLQSYPMAWNCADEQDLKLDLSTQGSISISPRFPAQPNQVRFGPQLPQLDQPIPLKLMGDKDGMDKGPAWWFQQPFTKVVVVRGNDFNAVGGVNGRRWFEHQHARNEKRQTIAPVASKPWFCYWNNTILEGFIYVTQNFSGQYQPISSGYVSSASPAADPEALAADYDVGPLDSYPSLAPGSGGSGRKRALVDPTQLAAYSKDIKIEERRSPQTDPAPYCVHMQIMNDGSASPLADENGNTATIQLLETPSTYDTRKGKRARLGKRGASARLDFRARSSLDSLFSALLFHIRPFAQSYRNYEVVARPVYYSITTAAPQQPHLSHNPALPISRPPQPVCLRLAVSIHTPEGPLPEYSIQKQSRFSRISAYIPVPPAKIPRDSLTNRPEQSTFAISITLLTPGLNVPYSLPKSTPEDPYPRARIVGALPSSLGERGRYSAVISPYLPLTTSPNETVAAYIYFDGRAKEEVATLLRRGEETWVNSRWVGVPESEGGGLAEREFLFREVGLERWLNGLDLEGKDAAAKIERRRQKVEKRRRRRKIKMEASDDEASTLWGGTSRGDKGVLRYSTNQRSPVENLSDEDEMFLSGSASDDDPVPEAAGQIKIALFRVLASGEIRRGEYSPQFKADDDDDECGRTENGTGSGETEEAIDHTTSFAKPKTLDPKSISTQTVTGIDGPEKPFAVFTFLYRGERQLQRMGILQSPNAQVKTPETTSKRKSLQDAFAGLKPLTPGGTVGFTGFRDSAAQSTSKRADKGISKKADSDMESDEDEDAGGRAPARNDDGESKESNHTNLSPEDARRQDEVAEGVQKIRLKRQHSAEPLNSRTPATRKSPASNTPTAGSTPSPPPHASSNLSTTPPTLLPNAKFDLGSSKAFDSGTVGSPLKRARASVSGLGEDAPWQRLGLGLSESFSGNNVGAQIEQAKPIKKEEKEHDEDEEL